MGNSFLIQQFYRRRKPKESGVSRSSPRISRPIRKNSCDFSSLIANHPGNNRKRTQSFPSRSK